MLEEQVREQDEEGGKGREAPSVVREGEMKSSTIPHITFLNVFHHNLKMAKPSYCFKIWLKRLFNKACIGYFSIIYILQSKVEGTQFSNMREREREREKFYLNII
jgi:hypothetical protein